jgi:hypothetical protein
MRQEERAKAGGERIARPRRSIEVCQSFCELRGSESPGSHSDSCPVEEGT